MQRQLSLGQDMVQRLLQARSSMLEGLQAAQTARQAAYANLESAAEVWHRCMMLAAWLMSPDVFCCWTADERLTAAIAMQLYWTISFYTQHAAHIHSWCPIA